MSVRLATLSILWTRIFKYAASCFFKVPLWSNSRYPLFHIVAHDTSRLDILPNFNLLRTLIRTRIVWAFISEIYGRH